MPRNTEAERPLNDLTRRIVGAAIEVHRCVGPGLMESAYHACLAWELAHIGCRVDSDILLPLHYKGVAIDAAYRIDLIVDRQVILELKSITRLLPVHEAQVLTYMRLSGVRTGLLINFNVPVLKDGIRRLVL